MIKKSIILCLAMMILPLLAGAHDFEVDGIYYNITSEEAKTAEVTFKGDSYDSYSNEYSDSITLPATVTHNGVAYSVTSIGWRAFYECWTLTAIIIPEGVTSIGNSAFYLCSSLTTITIPESVTSIGEYAFAYSHLTAITIPEGVTSIGEGVFACCNLTTITIPKSVTSIGYCAFYECHSLTTITIPEGVTSIGERAFWGCFNLTSIILSKSMTSIGDLAFGRCSSLYKVINYSDLDIQIGSTDNGSVADEAKIVYQGGELTTIGDFQFYTSDGIRSLINYIGRDTGIVLPDSYNGESYNIGEWAFSGCSSLTAITIPESVTSIGNGAFSDCSSLKSITILEGVTSIGDEAFKFCSSLTAITIPESVTSIGERAFDDCSSLESITIPKGVTSIGERAFYDCSGLKSITIPEGVTSIGSYVFSGCSSLKSITIPKSVTSIGYCAFYECSSLITITIPEGVTSIGEYAFNGCSSLESLHIGPNIDSYGDKVFEGCTAIKELTVMGSIMPEIPSEKLTSITLHSPIPLETKEFAAMVYRNATLNIPEGSLTRYQNADVWKNFWYVNEFDPKKEKAVFLTINQADNGNVKQHLTTGTICTFTITAFEGWKIHSVTFNDTDVTTQLTAEGIYTTPALQADAVLNIAYERVNSAISNAQASRIKVQGHRGTLRITGATEGDDIRVYTTDGTLVTQESAEESDTEITLPTGQVYIVKVADKVVKIGM